MSAVRLCRRIMSPAWLTPIVLATSMTGTIAATPAYAGDLLVAPTRIVLDGPRGAEVVLSNVGKDVATYRVSLEIKRMTETGGLEEIPVEKANDIEKQMLSMVSYSPRRVTLQPNQPQIIRLAVRAPQGLADGEYRAHMLFRAIPPAQPPRPAAQPGQGVQIALIPIYGVTIPIIVRQGRLQAVGGLANPRIDRDPNGMSLLRMELSRKGNGSLFGEMQVYRQGTNQLLMSTRGVAIYPELTTRTVTLPITAAQATALRGPVTIRYVQDRDAGGATIAEVSAMLR